MHLQATVAGLQLALRASLAAGISAGVAQLFGLQYPLYAFLAAVIVTDLSPALSRRLGLVRIVATIIGAVCGASLSTVLPPSAWGIGVGILVAMLACQALQVREGVKVAGFICGIIVLDHGPQPGLLSLDRFVETVLGVLVAWGVSYVPKLIRLPDKAENEA